LARGETPQRLLALSAWRETPFFSERERSALEWTGELTFIADTDVPELLYQRARGHFSEEEVVNLTLAIIAINAWNRIAKTVRAVPGCYQAAVAAA
jgi:alkylhydroperoxidase family enzyme